MQIHLRCLIWSIMGASFRRKPVRYRPNFVQYRPNTFKYRPNIVKHRPNIVQHRPNVVKHRPNIVEYGPNIVKNRGGWKAPMMDRIRCHWYRYNRNWQKEPSGAEAGWKIVKCGRRLVKDDQQPVGHACPTNFASAHSKVEHASVFGGQRNRLNPLSARQTWAKIATVELFYM